MTWDSSGVASDVSGMTWDCSGVRLDVSGVALDSSGATFSASDGGVEGQTLPMEILGSFTAHQEHFQSAWDRLLGIHLTVDAGADILVYTVLRIGPRQMIPDAIIRVALGVDIPHHRLIGGVTVERRSIGG
jgi:hypothetical protein